jgi:PAS domain S-box-containing protein
MLYPRKSRSCSERRRAAVALRQSEERYRNFIGQSTEGIWRVEFKIPIPIDTPVDEMVELICRHGFYAECNDAMARMYGFESASDITGKNCCELLNFSEREHREFVRAFIENGFRLNEGESHELDANGCDKYFLSNFAGTIEAGNLASVWGIQRDITDKRLAENALRASQEYLEVAQKTAMIGSFEFDFVRGY